VHLVVNHARDQVAALRINHSDAFRRIDAVSYLLDSLTFDEDVGVAYYTLIDEPGIRDEQPVHCSDYAAYQTGLHAPLAAGGSLRYSCFFEPGRKIAMIQSTTPSIEGRSISHYHGVVTGEAILGANIFKDIFAGIRDIVGGRSAAYERELQKAREIAFEELTGKARESGANAVVGIDIDYETVGSQGGMLMVSVSGTAVTVR
jgi:uncharacterized protein YbjQ (UPF0145 family)